MSIFISGYEVMQALGIEAFQLVEFARKGLIQPHNKYGKKVCDIKIKIKHEKPYSDAHRLARLYARLAAMEDNEKKLLPAKDRLVSYFFADKNSFKAKKDRIKSEIDNLISRGITLETIKQEKKSLPKEWEGCIWENYDLQIDEKEAEAVIERFLGFLYPKNDVDKLIPKEPTRSSSKTSSPYPTENSDTLILYCGKEAERLYELMKDSIKQSGKTVTHAGKKELHEAALSSFKHNQKSFSFLKRTDIDNETFYANCEKLKRQIVGFIIFTAMNRHGYDLRNYQEVFTRYNKLKRTHLD